MKSRIILSVLLPTLLLAAAPAMADSPDPTLVTTSGSVDVQTITEQGPGVTVQKTIVSGSDSPAIGDPLGNSPVTPKHDRGPELTNRLSYDDSCSDEACRRAFIRWNSNTSWQHDRATGLSLGWNGTN